MPDFSPSLALLRRLGIKIPNNGGTPMSDDEQTTIANNAQANDTPWNKSARSILDKILGGGRGFTNGMLGKDPGYTKDASYYGNMLAQGLSVTKPLAEAGLPFMALMKDRPSPQVFHGTKKVFDAFDEIHNDVTDTLGHMTHFAESPHYADSYASGEIKGFGRGQEKSIIPVKLGANNILDLVNPNMDDLSQAVASMPRDVKDQVVRNFKNSRQYDKLDKTKGLGDDILNRLKSPQIAKGIPFDAIKYSDVGQPSFAVDPSRTKIETPWGSPMSNTGNPLRVIKSDMTSPESKLIPSDSFNSTRVDPSKMYNKSKENLSASELMKLKGPIKPTSPVSESDAMKIFEDFKAGKISHTEANTLLGHDPNPGKNSILDDVNKPWISPGKQFYPGIKNY